MNEFDHDDQLDKLKSLVAVANVVETELEHQRRNLRFEKAAGLVRITLSAGIFGFATFLSFSLQPANSSFGLIMLAAAGVVSLLIAHSALQRMRQLRREVQRLSPVVEWLRSQTEKFHEPAIDQLISGIRKTMALTAAAAGGRK
ncbi:hypothetical protein [Micromonospora sp. IBHARD004]|uniref:hypothetical protein n=1 Tax=Micromonospora sp. IBHARD004 TaxID=3457764 RepID=UPI00405883C3